MYDKIDAGVVGGGAAGEAYRIGTRTALVLKGMVFIQYRVLGFHVTTHESTDV